MASPHRSVLAILAALLTLWGPVAGVLAADRRAAPCRLTVMTFNAQFLWDGVAPEEGQVEFPWKNSQTEAEDHMQRVAQVIVQSDPDIINLVEVEGIEALTTFNTKFLAGRGYRPYLVKGTDTFTGQDVGLLTRIDPENNAIERESRKGRAGDVLKEVSKNYVAKIEADNTKLALIGLHFLAIPTHPGRRLPREAQADAIRTRALELLSQGHRLIILGDFNDFDGDPSSIDHVDSTPITNVVRLLKAMDPATPSDDLTNALSRLPKAKRFTAFHDANRNEQVDPPRELTAIDHVLLSPELAAKVDHVDVNQQHDPRQVSDHFPLVVRLKLCDAGPVAPGTAQVRMTSLLPNPPGNDTLHEEVTLKNLGTQAVSLAGWTLRDQSGRTWTLNSLGTLQPGQEKTIKRNGQPMALNNQGDTIGLVNAGGQVVQSVTYPAVQEGEVVTPAN